MNSVNLATYTEPVINVARTHPVFMLVAIVMCIGIIAYLLVKDSSIGQQVTGFIGSGSKKKEKEKDKQKKKDDDADIDDVIESIKEKQTNLQKQSE